MVSIERSGIDPIKMTPVGSSKKKRPNKNGSKKSPDPNLKLEGSGPENE